MHINQELKWFLSGDVNDREARFTLRGLDRKFGGLGFSIATLSSRNRIQATHKI